MSPPTATATRRTAAGRTLARRRQAGRRRRRSVVGVVLAILALAVATAVLPLARRVVNDLSLPIGYQTVIREQAAAKHLDPALIAAVIYTETKFDPRTSSAGAVGLMQILPQTALFLAHRSGATSFHVSDLGTPRVNIAYGSYYLRYLLDEYHGSRLMAIAAYNGGEANVSQWVARARSIGARFTIGDIPFPETRAYVQRVLQSQHDYRTTYPTQLGYR
ncbi:MAG: lytic transglycosylase domain-containing protein [Actinomycetota bacterium]|nr:lytic transglycosylase domain-containing protein [Actinomycetota bacterium]